MVYLTNICELNRTKHSDIRVLFVIRISFKNSHPIKIPAELEKE